jgi:hypothetical protein
MATQLSDPRSSRVVVLVSPSEKLRIAANAAAADMSISDFMRTAAERYSEPSEAEIVLLRDLLAQVETGRARVDRAWEALETVERRAAALDEDRYRAEVRAELLARTDIDWDALEKLLSGIAQ